MVHLQGSASKSCGARSLHRCTEIFNRTETGSVAKYANLLLHVVTTQAHVLHLGVRIWRSWRDGAQCRSGVVRSRSHSSVSAHWLYIQTCLTTVASSRRPRCRRLLLSSTCLNDLTNSVGSLCGMAAILGSALTKGHNLHLHQALLPRDPRTLGVQGSAPWRTPSQQTARSLAIGRFHQCRAAVIGCEPARISNLRTESRGLTFTLPVDHAQVHAESTALQVNVRRGT